jgi:phosphoribosylglycinamide formyltransferase 2
MIQEWLQCQNEFELHMRAIIGWKTNTSINRAKSGAICAILADTDSDDVKYYGLEEAAKLGEFRIFGKPKIWKDRRIGIALAYSNNSYYGTWECRNRAREIANCITVSPK